MNLIKNLCMYYNAEDYNKLCSLLGDCSLEMISNDDQCFCLEKCRDYDYLEYIASKVEDSLFRFCNEKEILVYFLSHINYGDAPSLSEILLEIINNNLLYEGEYRVPYLDFIYKMCKSVELTESEEALLKLSINMCFSKPGVVGCSTNMYKLNTYNENIQSVIEQQVNVGDDGFNSNYMISQMKGGLSIDVLLGCPMGCAYCYRIDGEYSEEYINKWHPDSILSIEEIVNRLLQHPWFTPHITPLGIHMSTTEAFLPQIWPTTWQILHALDKLKLTNRVSIITKWTLDDEDIAKLETLKYVDLDICVCYSGMPTSVEPSSSKKRLDFLKRLVQTKSPHVHGIAYYRPIIEGYNTTDAIIDDVVSEIKKTGVKVVVLGGLKFSVTHRNYFLSKGLELPVGEFVKGKKELNSKTVDKIITSFKRIYNDEPLPYILRRSSCSRIMARQNTYPDYNAHWCNSQKNCSLICDHFDICSKATPPSKETVLALLERIGKFDALYNITSSHIIIYANLTMYEKTFITQNILFPVVDLTELELLNKKEKKRELQVFCRHILESIDLLNEEEALFSIIKMSNLPNYIEVLARIVLKCADLDNTKLWFECNWQSAMCSLRHSQSYKTQFKLVLDCVLQMFDKFVKQQDCQSESPERVWAIDEKGREFIHLTADKLLELNFAPQIEESENSWIEYADFYFESLDYDKYTDIRKIGYVFAIKSLLSKYYISRINYPIKVGIVVPMYNEVETVLGPSECNNGKNAIRVKYEQMKWLVKGTKLSYNFLYIDDFDPNKSGKCAQKVISSEDYLSEKIKVVFMESYDPLSASTDYSNPIVRLDKYDHENWRKGGSVLWGLYELAMQSNDYVAFTDCDLLYPLEQLGLLLDRCMLNRGVSIASRKLKTSFGYYNTLGIDNTALTYQKKLSDSLGIEVLDIQAGFKCMSREIALNIIPRMIDKSLSFDVELLALAAAKGYILDEVGVLTLHVYIKDRVRTPRNYTEMYNKAICVAKMHGLPVCDNINDCKIAYE